MFRKVFATVFPTALFSFAAYLILSDSVSSLPAREQRNFGYLLDGLAAALGRWPAGLLLLAIGLSMSAFAYYRYFAGKPRR